MCPLLDGRMRWGRMDTLPTSSDTVPFDPFSLSSELSRVADAIKWPRSPDIGEFEEMSEMAPWMIYWALQYPGGAIHISRCSPRNQAGAGRRVRSSILARDHVRRSRRKPAASTKGTSSPR